MTSGVDHRPTPEQRRMVEAMAAYGVPQADIAAVIKITRETLAKHYREELDTASAKANSAIAEKLFRKAIDGDTTCMIFWLKTRARWAETVRQEISGKDGGAIPVAAVNVTEKVLARLPSDVLQQLIAEQEKEE